MSAQPTTNRYSNSDELVQALSQRIGKILKNAVDKRDRASLVVSGGRTPIALFETLSQMKLPWDKVVITLADERWVEPTSEDSNEKLVRDKLLQNQARGATFLSLKSDFPTPEEGRLAVEENLLGLPRPLDVLILGMGTDGHTASLFPCSDELDYAMAPERGERLVVVHPKTAPHERISFSLPTLLDSRHIFLHLEGEKKAQVLDKALESDDVKEMPIRAFWQNRQTPFEIYLAV